MAKILSLYKEEFMISLQFGYLVLSLVILYFGAEFALDSAEKDKNVGVIVLSGAGDRAFCAGGDMNWESSKEFQDHEYEFHIHLTKCSKPIIAKVDGYAIGGGNHMAYFCDLTIASENSIFGQTIFCVKK